MGQICAQCGQMHAGYPCPKASVLGARLTAINDDELLVGSVVADRYHVGDVIGQGLTGTVFAAEHMSFSRGAALKVLRPRYASVDLIHRVFHGEARTAWRIVHPCLVEVFDVGTLPDGAPFFVMEPLEGETLASRLRRERLSLAAAVDVMMQLLSALEVIHSKDQLLRDLRPQNVYLAQRRGCRPVVKILDFGLARLVPLEKIQAEWDVQRGVVTEADTSGPLALPYYLSPERTRGEHGLSPSSDLFVVSTIFYEALTGERPFISGSFTGLLAQIARGQPTPLDELRPDVPPDLATLVARALSASPLSRPGSAKEMQDELRAIFEGGKRRSVSRIATGSPSSMMAVPSVGPVDSAAAAPRDRDPSVVAYSPADDEPHTAPPSALSTERPNIVDDLYGDQTETGRKYIDLQVPSSGVLAPSSATAAGSSLPRFPDPAPVDEASADNPQKTIRPPEIGIDIEFEAETEAPTTSRESELDAFVRQLRAERAARPPSGTPSIETKEDEETETMQLTPELRARIEQMTRGSGDGSAPPPPTRRLLKPPR